MHIARRSGSSNRTLLRALVAGTATVTALLVAHASSEATNKPPLHAKKWLAITEDGTALAAVFRDPARLVLFDAATGAVLANVPTCGDADDVFFDNARQRLYVSCGAAAVDVLRKDGTTVTELARISTSSGARTSLFVPQLDRLFVAERAGLLGSNAAIRVYRPTP